MKSYNLLNLWFRQLAPQCPYVEGSAVFKARALHAYYTPGLYYDDLKSCNNVGVYKTNTSSNTTTNLTLENEYLRKLMPNQFQSTIDTNNDDISIYPNPGTDIVTIKGMTFSGKIQLYDMIGRLVLEQDLRSPLSTIDISQLSNGVYNYSITKQGQKVYTGKIIKE